MKLITLIEQFRLEAQSSVSSELTITGVNSLADAVEGELSFFTNRKYRKDLRKTRASAVLLEQPDEDCPAIQLIVKNPYAVLARILQKMAPEKLPEPTIHPTSVIAETAKVGANCHIGPHCIISSQDLFYCVLCILRFYFCHETNLFSREVDS